MTLWLVLGGSMVRLEQIVYFLYLWQRQTCYLLPHSKSSWFLLNTIFVCQEGRPDNIFMSWFLIVRKWTESVWVTDFAFIIIVDFCNVKKRRSTSSDVIFYSGFITWRFFFLLDFTLNLRLFDLKLFDSPLLHWKLNLIF
jgi:hypothetical protein